MTLHCCACGTLCTCTATGSSWTHTVCVAVHTAGTCFQRVSCSSPVCLSASQANTRITPFHQSLRSSEIHHKVEEVKVSGRSRCSAARGSGLTVGHMTTSQVCCRPQGCTGVDEAVVVSPRCHLSTPESLTSWITCSSHVQAPPTSRLHPRGSDTLDMEIFLFSLTRMY